MTRYYVLSLAILTAFSTGRAEGAIVSITHSNQDDIVIPVFDPSLGTLNSVSLQVLLLAGETTVNSGHQHTSVFVTSNNRASLFSPPLNPVLLGSISESGVHGHSASTPTYVGGGLDLGSFSFSTAPDGEHVHLVSILSGGPTDVSFTDLTARWTATVNIGEAAGASHAYAEQAKNFVYTGAALTSFLQPVDIVIGGGTFSTSGAGSHTHQVAAFSLGAFNYSSFTTSVAAAHVHSIDPRFTTVTVFDYTPIVNEVPEPGSMLLISLGACSIVGASRRRRMAS